MKTAAKATPLRPRHVAWGAVWMALLVSGGVIQTHLRFCERDVEIQTRKAQEELVALADDRADLQAEVEALRTGWGVRERAAADLGLVPAGPTDVHRLEIHPDLWTRYAAARDATGAAHENPALVAPAWMEWIDRAKWIAESGGAGEPGR